MVRRKRDLPDFYNIMLERHKDDPEGYDILFVDAIVIGNYSSRLSHSCSPNCTSVTTVVDGRYVIAVYATKDIRYGEELTFDYCSVTENRFEHQKAICLCGQSNCRVFYLDLANSTEFAMVQDEHHCFLARSACLLRAGSDFISQADRATLDRFNIRSLVLDGCPRWLRKWICLTLGYVEFEYEKFYEKAYERFWKYFLDQENLEYSPPAQNQLTLNSTIITVEEELDQKMIKTDQGGEILSSKKRTGVTANHEFPPIPPHDPSLIDPKINPTHQTPTTTTTNKPSLFLRQRGRLGRG